MLLAAQCDTWGSLDAEARLSSHSLRLVRVCGMDVRVRACVRAIRTADKQFCSHTIVAGARARALLQTADLVQRVHNFRDCAALLVLPHAPPSAQTVRTRPVTRDASQDC